MTEEEELYILEEHKLEQEIDLTHAKVVSIDLIKFSEYHYENYFPKSDSEKSYDSNSENNSNNDYPDEEDEKDYEEEEEEEMEEGREVEGEEDEEEEFFQNFKEK